MIPRISMCLAAALLATPALAQDYKPLPRALAALAPEDFAGRIHVSDDTLDEMVEFSTQSGYQRGQPMIGAYADDVHLRARIHRATGQVTWQVWHTLINRRSDSKITEVTYKAGDRIQTTAPTIVEAWEDMCSPGDSAGLCHSYMRVAFDLPEAVVTEIASRYQHGSRTPWPVRFKSGDGQVIRGGLAPAEAAGLVLAVNSRKPAS